jgi:hypothetical protein
VVANLTNNERKYWIKSFHCKVYQQLIRNIIQNRLAISNAMHVDPRKVRLALTCVSLRTLSKECVTHKCKTTVYVGLLLINFLSAE